LDEKKQKKVKIESDNFEVKIEVKFLKL